MEEQITNSLNELVENLILTKFGSTIFYYDLLYMQIIEEYKENKIDMEKIKLCLEIMNNYYPGVTYIDNFFNIQ